MADAKPESTRSWNRIPAPIAQSGSYLIEQQQALDLRQRFSNRSRKSLGRLCESFKRDVQGYLLVLGVRERLDLENFLGSVAERAISCIAQSSCERWRKHRTSSMGTITELSGKK